jgi:hypothetical protein
VHEPFDEDLYTSPINESTCSVVSDYNYPVEDLLKMQNLFGSWELKCVYQTCVGKKIAINYSV